MSAVPADISQVDEKSPFYPRTKNLIDNFHGMEGYMHSPLNLQKRFLEKKEVLPKMYFSCGTEDPICYKDYVKFQEFVKENGLEAEFLTLEGYSHEWAFWDICVQNAVEKFVRLKGVNA